MKMRKPSVYFILTLIVALPLVGGTASAQSVVIRRQEAPKPLKPGELSYVNAFPFNHFLGFDQQVDSGKKPNFFYNTVGENAGLSFLSSALVPGLGQAAHRQWIKTGLFTAVEAITLYAHFHLHNQGHNLEEKYIQFADNNWSVVNYATYLVKYHNHFFPDDQISVNSLANNGADLSTGATYTHEDWNRVNLQKLHDLENITYYNGTSGVAFSHNMPEYGSQQYYELMSKYFQFAPGWKDFNSDPGSVVWGTEGMPAFFNQGAGMADRYNNKYRMATNVLTITIINHFVSAFDAFITTKLRARNVHVESNGMGAKLVFGF